MKKTFLLAGAVLGLLAVLLGAFGAHGLEKIVDKDAVESFETGVRYQMYHAFFFLFVGIWDGIGIKKQRLLFWLVLMGIILFSCSIYLLVLGPVLSWDLKIIAFLTPLGGTLLIGAWFFLGYFILTKKSTK
ncbi:DUF423 domain-containing protein [Flagellimonas allohymeniacidonis]|uniref:DUF423 domain-containing protein n=1 Tax=Flagellimonas allohymeniacidonis TaxID=2517819 RepID=A0A4Q8QC24_9FLAO|nr:DUF423 domain-containing protein [Allomuricauda hymeniacidonis]TAI47942.1 DUF423 domain-containing protein [Allomuricauda hymeniacidonis]